MKKALVTFACVSMGLSIAPVAVADSDFYGIIEQRPNGKVGTWIIGGRSFEVTEQTKLDEDDGSLVVGVCVEVDMDNGRVEELDEEPTRKCTR